MPSKKPKPIATIPPRKKQIVDEGRPGLRLLVGLVVLGAVGWTAWKVPVGGRTAVEHAFADVDWPAVRTEAGRFVRATGDFVASLVEPAPVALARNDRPNDASGRLEAPPSGPAPVRAPEGRRPPAASERLEAEDRAALEALLE